MADASTNRRRQANWMAELPNHLHDVKLTELAIPGSHDSFTFLLDKNAGPGPDLAKQICDMVKMFGGAGKDALNRWSKTQTMTFTEQLSAGIRYLDLRIAMKASPEEIFYLHGIYGPKVEDSLKEILEFADAHPKEIILLDFNHFYNMSTEAHRHLLQVMVDVFGKKICHPTDFESLTLNKLWENESQIIIFYQDDVIQDGHPQFWSKNAILAPWPNTDNLDKFLEFHNKAYEARSSAETFYVLQCIPTPDTGYIVSHLMSSLKDSLVKKFAPAITDWLKTKERGSKGINICIADFVEMANFIPTVLSMNK